MFSKRKTSQYIDSKEFIKRSKEKFGEEIYGYDRVKYVNLKTPIELHCNLCGNYYWQMPNEHMYSVGAGCPVCAMKHSGEVRLLETKDAIQRIIEVYGENYWDFSKFHYTGFSRKIIVIDPKTREEFEISYESLLLRDPHYHKKSLGEYRISHWLDRNNIKYIPQHKIRSETFSNKRFISVDFYLENLNMVIEFNGIQHYKFSKVGFFHRNEQDFIKQVKRDKELINYCKNNSISYLEIPYTYMDSIESILEKVVLEDVDPITIIEYPSIEEVKL